MPAPNERRVPRQPDEESPSKPTLVETETPQVNGAMPSLTLKLRKPIQAHGEEIKEITFREPNAGDIEAAGNPVEVDPTAISETGRPKTTFNEKKMSAMISRLAVIPPSSVRMMDTRDWNNACWTLFYFFVPD